MRKQFYLFLVIALVSFKTLYSQPASQLDSSYLRTLLEEGLDLEDKGQLEEAALRYHQVIDNFDNVFAEPHELLPLSLMNLGSVHQSEGAFGEALDDYNRALEEFKALHPTESHPDFGRLYNQMAIMYRVQARYLLAETYYDKALAIFTDHFGEEDFNVLAVTYNKATMINEMGDYGKSQRFLERALQLAQKILPPDHPVFANLHEVIGYNYTIFDNFDRALYHLNLAVKVREQYADEMPFELAQTYAIACEPYLQLEDFATAQIYLDKAKHAFAPIAHNYPLAAAQQAYLQARIYEGGGAYAIALKYFRKAHSIEQEVNGAKHPDVLAYWNDIALLQLKMETPDSALLSFAQPYQHYTTEKEQAARYLEWDVFLVGCSGLGAAHLQRYRAQQNPQDLKKAVAYHDQALRGLNETIKYINDPQTIIGTKTESRHLLEAALETYMVADAQAASTVDYNVFTALEMGKALLLMSGDQFRKEGAIPAHLSQREQDLKAEIEKLYTDRLWALEDGEPQLASELEEPIFRLTNSLQAFQDSLQEAYPAYRQWQYPTNFIPDLGELQKALGPHQAWVSYFVGTTSLFIAKITKGEVRYFQLPLPANFKQQVLRYHELLQSYLTWKDDPLAAYTKKQEELTHLGQELYHQLWAPLGELPEEVLICADDVLWLLPFESLPRAEEVGRYLLEDHQLMYNYAAAWWLKLKEKTITSEQLLAFAPSFSASSNQELATLDRSYTLQNLLFSTEELSHIAQYYELTSYQGEAATKAMFLQLAGQYGVLHFATHAMLDTLDSALNYLAFYPQEEAAENWKLLLYEIYQLDIEAAMVVLSTCRSGGGPLRTGEGINSLAQAFSYAGAKSVITSLWDLNDQAAAEIMGYFYKNLADGQTKAKALQQAKLQYLHQQTDPRMAHPYYWSALIGLGDESPLFGSNTIAWWWYVLGLGVLLLGGWWAKRR